MNDLIRFGKEQSVVGETLIDIGRGGRSIGLILDYVCNINRKQVVRSF